MNRNRFQWASEQLRIIILIFLRPKGDYIEGYICDVNVIGNRGRELCCRYLDSMEFEKDRQYYDGVISWNMCIDPEQPSVIFVHLASPDD